MVFAASLLLLSVFESGSPQMLFTAVAATFNNIGPGLGEIGPMANYAALSIPGKYILMFDMLAGRLELYPMLILFVPEIWTQKK